MKKSLILLILILALSLRLFSLDKFPSGFYSDEAMFSYEAYSLYKTGNDQYGNHLPLTLKAFGDYRPGLFSYFTIPTVAVFGLNEFSARLPSALFSLATVILIISLASLIFANPKISLLAGFVMAIFPWDLQMARMSHETNLATFLITLGIFTCLKAVKQKERGINNYILWFYVSLFSFGLSLYAYYSSRLFVFLFIPFLFIVFHQILLSSPKKLIGLVLFFAIVAIPLASIMFDSQEGWSRIGNVSLWGDKGILSSIIQNRQEGTISGQDIPPIFHNKFITPVIFFLSAYLIHFEPRFLLFSGDPNKIYSTPDNGILLITFLPLFFIGLYYLIKNINKEYLVLICWILLGIIPDALTRFAPATPRVHLIVPAVSIVIALGLFKLYLYFKKSNPIVFTSVISIFFILTIYHFAYYLDSYYFHLPVRYASQWQYGVSQIASYIKSHEKDNSRIWISDSAGSWIYYLFYLKYDPKLAQKEVKLTGPNEYGMGKVTGFGKYTFSGMPEKFDTTQNILYIGSPTDFPRNLVPAKIIYYPNNDPAYYIVDTQTIKDYMSQKLN